MNISCSISVVLNTVQVHVAVGATVERDAVCARLGVLYKKITNFFSLGIVCCFLEVIFGEGWGCVSDVE